jgi:hypothetical protein
LILITGDKNDNLNCFVGTILYGSMVISLSTIAKAIVVLLKAIAKSKGILIAITFESETK